MSDAIKFENISKQYRLGLVSTQTLSHDINRWWKVNVLRQEDPYLKIGSVNDRSKAADGDYVWALKDISFSVAEGDVIGIIGKNGAGKSTLLKILSKVTTPTTGTIKARGRIASLLEVGTGFHQEMTGRENIYMNGAIMGMSKNEITRKLDQIIDFSGCERYVDTPVKRYSSGMTVRLGFAIAAHLDPEILVVDEVLAVGDAEFQKKAIGKMQDVSRGQGRTVLFVSHHMPSIQQLCSSCVLLENGMISTIDKTNVVIDKYIREQSIKGNYERQGSGFVRFQSFSLTKDSIAIGEDLELNLALKTSEYIAKAIIHINIYNDNEQYVLQASSEDSEFILTNLAPNATYHVKCVLPHLNAIPGNYSINLWVGTSYEWFDWLKGCLQFSIYQDQSYIKRVSPYPSDTKLVLQSEWKNL